jgi:hypothetical protein
MLTDFLGKHVTAVDGKSIPLSDFVTAFHRYLHYAGIDPTTWDRKRIVDALRSEGFAVGNGQGAVIVANVTTKAQAKRWVADPARKNHLKLVQNA